MELLIDLREVADKSLDNWPESRPGEFDRLSDLI